MYKISPIDVIDFIIKQNKCGNEPLDKDKKYTFSNIKYNKNLKGNYTIKKCIYSDGTFLHEFDLIIDVILTVINCKIHDGTIYKEQIDKLKFLEYTIGDLQIENEYGDFNIKDKPWLKLKVTVSLPVSCKYYYDKEYDISIEEI